MNTHHLLAFFGFLASAFVIGFWISLISFFICCFLQSIFRNSATIKKE